MDPERKKSADRIGQALRHFRFVAEYALKEMFNRKDDVLKEESDAEDSRDDDLYQVTSASRIDI